MSNTSRGRTRLIGWYLVYISGFIVASGLAIGFVSQLGISLEGIGPYDTAEASADRSQRMAIWLSISIAISACGFGLLAFGIYRVIVPLQIELQNATNQRVDMTDHD